MLADDHPLIRGGLRRVLDLDGGFSVVGEAGDVEGALALTRAHRPRVVVLDLNMPGEPTLPAIPRFVEANPGTAVLVLTMEAEPGFARRALQAGLLYLSMRYVDGLDLRGLLDDEKRLQPARAASIVSQIAGHSTKRTGTVWFTGTSSPTTCCSRAAPAESTLS